MLKYNTDADATSVTALPSSNGISIYPVPATDLMTARNNNAALSGGAAFITDLNGKIVCRFKIEPLQYIEKLGWAPGVYCLHLADGRVMKVVKQ